MLLIDGVTRRTGSQKAGTPHIVVGISATMQDPSTPPGDRPRRAARHEDDRPDQATARPATVAGLGLARGGSGAVGAVPPADSRALV